MLSVFGLATENSTPVLKVPAITGPYVHIYKPAGDIFPGTDTAELKTGQFYNEWVPNDHCFVKGPQGRWHSFGITHPKTGLDNVHAGECLSFHAIAPKGQFAQTIKKACWKDLPKVLPPSERPGEPLANHAPSIIKHNELYWMVYGPTPLRYATSEDLMTWTPKGELKNAPQGRDPSLLYWNDTYYLLVCGEDDVRLSTSKDLQTWTDARQILKMKDTIAPESPTLIRYNDTFYLFVCGWNGVWDRKELQGAYQHTTYVYQSNDPEKFDTDAVLTTLNAHAPEIIQDEKGDWYISSVEWPNRGVSIAGLNWKN